VITIFDSNAVISDGDTYDTVVVKGGGTVVEMRGGYIRKLYTYDTSVFNMSDGDIDVVRTNDASIFNLSGGFIILFYCYNSSTVNASGGNAYYGMIYRDSSTGNIYGGAYRIDLHDSSKVNVYGGCHFRLGCYGSGTLNVYGGSLYIDVEGGTVNIYRGHIERTLDCSGSSIVNVYGYAFDYDPTGGVRGYGQITGFYSDHTVFSIDLEHGAYPHINLVSVVKTVDIDIKPGSCPNPLNVKSKGVLPVAILGADDLDVNSIDAASTRLGGVAPIRSSYEDVATPIPEPSGTDIVVDESHIFTDPFPITLNMANVDTSSIVITDTTGLSVYTLGDDYTITEGSGRTRLNVTTLGIVFPNVSDGQTLLVDYVYFVCECNTIGPDGYLDLTLKFKTQEIVEAIGDVNDGDILPLELTGVSFDETPIEGADCILVWLQSSIVED
jgi:hypothetical protein